MVTRRELGKPKKKITLILVPNAKGSKSKKIDLNLPALVLLLAALLTVFSFIGFYFFQSVAHSGKLLHYYYLQSENEKLSKDITVFVSKTKMLEEGITELEEREKELRRMLGINNKDFSYKKKSN